MEEQINIINILSGLMSCNNRDDENEFDVIKPSSYSDNNDYVNFLKNNANNITVLSTNICSMRSKFETISVYLEHVKNLSGFLPSVLCFQEAWIDENDDISIQTIFIIPAD